MSRQPTHSADTSAQPNKFDQVFTIATRFCPHEYQKRLACGQRGERCDDTWMRADVPCESTLIDIPTGFGKTAAVVLAWLWNRVFKRRDDWPRRLVYCLPMRTLVEQTRQSIDRWLANVELSDHIFVHVLMGGQNSGEWDVTPGRDTILVGTQDMLLSRALNRGYGMSRYRWPMHFGLLNNDCLWVMDEVQLMGPGLWTSAQLDWMRRDRFKSLRPCVTWWMSATIRPNFLETLDRKNAELPVPKPVCLERYDETHEVLQARRPCKLWRQTARSSQSQFAQTLAQAVINEHRDSSLSLVVCNTVSAAQRIYASIRDLYTGDSDLVLLTSRFRAGDRDENQDRLLAFEAARQRDAKKRAVSDPGLLCVSTQVIEAGVDISARRLWSEVAPWPSIIQRLGRLNRGGQQNADSLAYFWKKPVTTTGTQFIGPYDAIAVEVGHKLIKALVAVCRTDNRLPAKDVLAELSTRDETKLWVEKALTPTPEPCPRAIDLHGLFSTEPDVFGGFTDVSSFIRNQDRNADVTVFWREWHSEARLRRSETLSGPAFARDEGCPVAAHRLRDFLDKRSAWIWDDKNEKWETIHAADIRPGMLVMLPRSYGGYSRELGWTGRRTDKLESSPLPGEPYEQFEDDRYAESGYWVTVADHLKDTEHEAMRIVRELDLKTTAIGELGASVVHASSKHDIGKALSQWQSALPKPFPLNGGIWAKAPFQFAVVANGSAAAKRAEELIGGHCRVHRAEPWKHDAEGGESRFVWLTDSRVTTANIKRILGLEGLKRAWNVPFRPGLRHEAATALALWHNYYRDGNRSFAALSIYLCAAHHGKVRTVLASRTPSGDDVCGIPKTDTMLPWNDMPLDFTCAVDGAAGHFSEDGTEFIFEAPGWSGLVADLLGGWERKEVRGVCGAVGEGEPCSLGPFVLAYLETLVRSADERASTNPRTRRRVES